MKKNYLLLLFFIFGLISCSKDKDKLPDNHLIINGTKYKLATAFIDDQGTNLEADIPYRAYNLYFANDDSDQPETYIQLKILSPSTTRLQEGTYTYSYWPNASQYSYITLGFDIQYDNTGEEVAGVILSESFVDLTAENTVIVSMKDDNKVFEFEMTFEKSSTVYNISGYFEGTLAESNIYLKK